MSNDAKEKKTVLIKGAGFSNGICAAKYQNSSIHKLTRHRATEYGDIAKSRRQEKFLVSKQ
ncbi:MAG: hypothetical protein IJ566_06285 [Cardiobacteriaceae bacterium]|nr:hypothetical protein [Cardiobacteriaceae bacterium]